MINLSEDRILDFLDGRLATPDEEDLLHTLAVSPERRQLMREHMKLRELTSTIARQDRFSVPESVTTQLFSRLEEEGFTPPVTPESILRVPQAASMRYAGAATALGAGSMATAISSGWRFGMIGLLTASVMSFVLGAGAYYVFGSELGLRTHSQELAALQHSRMHHVSPGLASQYAVAQNNAAEAAPVSGNASNGIIKHAVNNSVASKNFATSNANIASIFPIGSMGHVGAVQNLGISNNSNSIPSANSSNVAENDNAAPIGYTAPKEQSYAMEMDEMRMINGPAPIVPSAIPTPLADERGTISMRYGAGESPQNTNAPVSSLNEFRFGMTTWNYVLWRASIGYLSSYERVAQVATSGPSTGQIITPESSSPTNTTVIGLETGVTLDPIGIPVDALVGFLWSGDGSSEYSPLYGRASLMAHFEPWQMLEISAGFEGVWYTHYLDGAINRLQSSYALPASSVASKITSEVGGFVGPSLELGWHF